MVESVEMVKDSDGGNWEITMVLMETLEESVEVYGNEGALSLLNAGLKTRKQNIARNAFRSGKTREEAEELMGDYRPGQSSKVSKKKKAYELIMSREKSEMINSNAELKASVTDAMAASKWQDVIDLLEGSPE